VVGSFEGKIALVTGWSYGIGQAITERLAASGTFVALTNHPNDTAVGRKVVAGIEAKGGRAFAIDALLGPAGTAEALAERFVAELRKRSCEPAIDILVNNVGGGGYGRVPDTTNEFFDEVVGRNVRVPYFLVKSLMPYMRHGGCVINISSTAARLVNPDLEVYSLAKAAQNKFTSVLAKELGPLGVRVNGVMPGFIDTAVNRPYLSDPANLKQVLANTALGRLGETRDIADLVHALASPDFRFVTGQVIEASGGFMM
jgi:3-oxoacyl-[acyl-carrier protein] reductase